MGQYINAIEKAQMREDIPDFRAGDTVAVKVKVKEGTRERIQTFDGVVIARRNRGFNSAFTVRKISHDEGVERVFQLHSPVIDSIEVKRYGDVRKAKLYYLRDLTGRAARIKDDLSRSAKAKSALSNATAAAAEKQKAATTAVVETKETAKETATETAKETATETAAETATETATETAAETATETATETAAETAKEVVVEKHKAVVTPAPEAKSEKIEKSEATKKSDDK